MSQLSLFEYPMLHDLDLMFFRNHIRHHLKIRKCHAPDPATLEYERLSCRNLLGWAYLVEMLATQRCQSGSQHFLVTQANWMQDVAAKQQLESMTDG